MRLTQQELVEVISHKTQFRPNWQASPAATLPEEDWWEEVQRAANFRHALNELEAQQ